MGRRPFSSPAPVCQRPDALHPTNRHDPETQPPHQAWPGPRPVPKPLSYGGDGRDWSPAMSPKPERPRGKGGRFKPRREDR